MNILYFLIGCSVAMAVLFLLAFYWAYKSGQNEDLHTPSIRMLFDDDPLEEKNDKNHIPK